MTAVCATWAGERGPPQADARLPEENERPVGAPPRALSWFPSAILIRVSATPRYAKNGDVHIAYQVVGDGPRDIVLVPGWTSRASASPGMACALLESLRAIDVAAAATSVHVPALVLHRRDDFVPIEPARRLAQLIPWARFVELEGPDHALAVGDTETVVGEIEEFVTGTRRRPEPTRALLTVLFTDIVGSTQLAAELGDASWRELLDEHHRMVRGQLEDHQGRQIKTVGDGFLATFDGPARDPVRQGDHESRAQPRNRGTRRSAYG
jgi:hypothetical protein